jgi:hypothetical protein
MKLQLVYLLRAAETKGTVAMGELFTFLDNQGEI